MLYSYPCKTFFNTHLKLVVLECSGDKCNLFELKIFGEQWGKGAISQGRWKGVPLRTLLDLSG
ncbi:molybdopterin-dependent oxidoreductase [Peribacillus sp. NPDC058002]|uniref:molybdopterin-dependent oxidoreductase n=1 Tax=Peribacillus sp. NPDC058002 TaxID=3346301 RepID=UPI0036D93341